MLWPTSAHSGPKSVCIIYSFGANASPYQAVASSFQGALVRDLGEQIDFFHTYLDSERFPDPRQQAVLVEFLQKRFAGRHLDLIVTIGAPAAQFVLEYRERLFAETPVLFLSVDQRFLDPGSIGRNATLFSHEINLRAAAEDMLQMAPDTTNIVLVFGDSPLARSWGAEASREFHAVAGQVKITSLIGLSLDEIEKRVATLPPHSFIFFGLLVRDGRGVTYDGYEPLSRLHSVANAPIYGYFQSQMGLGITGGRLYREQPIGTRAAEAAVRILRGEPAGSIQPQILKNPPPVYDWRELNRWGITESRLPPGSSILFRRPTFWQQYRWRILGVALLCILQTILIIGLLTSLARRRRTERSLRESDDRYRRLFEASSDALLVADFESGRIHDANPAAVKMYGYTPEEFASLKARDISAEPEKTLRSMAAGEKHVPLRWHRRKDGAIFPVEISAGPLTESTRSHIVAVRDITERLGAEKMLRESEQKYRRLHQSMTDAFVSVDMTGRIQEFNPAYRQMLGYSEEELRLLTYVEITPERWHEFEAGIIRDQVLQRGYSDVYEKEYRRKDGTTFPVELRSSLLRDDSGVPRAMWAVVRDVTERRQRERQLRESEERFRHVAEAVSEFIWELDREGLYLYASPSVEKILGYHPDELVEKIYFYDLFPPDIREQLKTAGFEALANRHRFYRFPNPVVGKSGAIIHLETTGFPIVDEAGHVTGYRGASTDVTELRRRESEAQSLREELALFSRVATVSEFTASLAHELNQPLAAILGNAQAALRIMQTGVPDLDQVREILSDIVADDQRAAGVIRSVRSMFKKDSSEHQSLQFDELIKEINSLVRNDAVVRGVSIDLHLGSPLPAIKGDRVQLQQVVLNLVINAFDAMEGSARPRKLLLRTRQTDAELVLDVVDSGVGIPADKLNSIFEPFVSTKATGLGMGLSLSRSIVIGHNGRLWAENNGTGGATFHLALPVQGVIGTATTVRAERDPQDGAAAQRHGLTVLIADDRDTFRRAVSSMLVDLPELKLLAEAADGAEAIQKASELKPDLVLLDVGLPTVNGVEAAARIHAVAPHAKILFLTQYDSPDFVRAALRTGALGYVLKVDAGSELLAASKAVLCGEVYLSSGLQH